MYSQNYSISLENLQGKICVFLREKSSIIFSKIRLHPHTLTNTVFTFLFNIRKNAY